MRDRSWQVAIFGTFDVENYGDLLFPLIAESELTERLGPLTLHRFSYHTKTPPTWPYAVTSVTELPEIARQLDGVLIGGGCIVRFDKEVAPGYDPPTPAIHHPTGYWLTPALIALQQGIPVMWNAPGMHCYEIPAWAESLMEMALANSSYIAVRDEPTRSALERFVGEGQISVLPDTAFGISRLREEWGSSAEFLRLREMYGLTDPYIVIQPTRAIEPFLSFLKNQAQQLHGFRFLVVPIGPVLGDNDSMMDGLPGMVRLPDWPHPMLLAELISQAAAVVGHSYHLAITALGFGVPVFTSADLSVGKFTGLSGFDTVYSLPKDSESDADLFVRRVGKKTPSAEARKAIDQLTGHWDRIAAIVREGGTATQPRLNRFWLSLPNVLEAGAHELEAASALLETERLEHARRREEERIEHSRRLEEERIEHARRIDELRNILTLARGEIVAADERIAYIYDSTSMRVTAPLRAVLDRLKRQWGTRRK